MITPYYIFPSFKESDKKFPVYVVTVGKECNPLPVNRPDGIPNYQAFFVLDGSGEMILNDKKYTLKKNSFMYLKPNTPQYYYPLGTWEVIWVTYNYNGLSDMLSIDNGVYNLADTEPFVNLLSLMLRGRGTINFSKNASMLLYNLLIELNEHLNVKNYYGTRSLLQPAIEYIDKNYKNVIEPPHLAELCHISYEHFCRNFKKNYHMRPLEYVQKLRIQEAKRLLASYPEMSITEIAGAVGYASTSYFEKHFKAIEKITPSAFRKQNLL